MPDESNLERSDREPIGAHFTTKDSGPNDRLMLFDLSIYGHHATYIQYLLDYWCREEIPGYLDIVVSPRFLHVHADVVQRADQSDSHHIRFVAITAEEENRLSSRGSSIQRNVRNYQEWRIFHKYASQLQPSHALILYLDTCILPLVTGAQSPCKFSGIYFRPTLHYGQFNQQLSWNGRLQQWREQFLLRRLMRHPQLQTLLSLDSFAVEEIKQLGGHAHVLHLPDPVSAMPKVPESMLEKQKESLGIDPNRRVLLLFGALTARKGVYQLFEAISLLETNICQQLCLLLVGEADPSNRERIHLQVATIAQAQPVQIIEQYGYIDDQDVPVYFQLADVILAPYQKHVGMSGILLLAASARKPVLSSDYGLMGKIVDRYSLGLTVDSTIPSQIAYGLSRLLLESPDSFCDYGKMDALVAHNSVENFARLIFQETSPVKSNSIY